MKFHATRVEGVVLIELGKKLDARGYFARTFCAHEFEAQALDCGVVQCNVSLSRKAGTLRGMHLQVAPHEETKLVRCTRGAIFDVALDLRAESATFKQWVGVELDAENGRMLYVPRGCAHGYVTLAPDSEVAYNVNQAHRPECQRGVRYDDPSFGIEWPAAVRVISERDAAWPDFRGML